MIGAADPSRLKACCFDGIATMSAGEHVLNEPTASASEFAGWAAFLYGVFNRVISAEGVMYLSFVLALLASAYSIWRRHKRARMVESEHALKMGLMRDVREQNRKLYAAKMRAIELGDIEGADSIQLAQPTTFGDLEL